MRSIARCKIEPGSRRDCASGFGKSVAKFNRPRGSYPVNRSGRTDFHLINSIGSLSPINRLTHRIGNRVIVIHRRDSGSMNFSECTAVGEAMR